MDEQLWHRQFLPTMGLSQLSDCVWISFLFRLFTTAFTSDVPSMANMRSWHGHINAQIMLLMPIYISSIFMFPQYVEMTQLLPNILSGNAYFVSFLGQVFSGVPGASPNRDDIDRYVYIRPFHTWREKRHKNENMREKWSIIAKSSGPVCYWNYVKIPYKEFRCFKHIHVDSMHWNVVYGIYVRC